MSPAARRSTGRPRSVAADQAILLATRELLATQGWSGFSIEAVAARAGVAKTTVYRRFASRTELAVAAIGLLHLVTTTATGEGTSVAEDIASSVRAVAEVVNEPVTRAAYLAIVAEAGRDPELRETLDRDAVAPIKALVSDGMIRAEARGEVGPDPDGRRAELLYDVLAGTVVHRALIRGVELDDAFFDALSAAVVAAFCAPPPG